MHSTELVDLLPHQGPALWLERLLDHDQRSMRGIASGACLDRLGANASPTLLFEAAAQLCAAHGALYGSQLDSHTPHCGEPATSQTASTAAAPAPPPVLVGKVNAVRLHAAPVIGEGDLAVSVIQQAASAAGAQYTFAIHHQERLVLDGSLLLVRADA